MSKDTPPSITAVAKAAGVSVATVSRVLNNSKPVNEPTRRRVEDVVAKLGYRVNLFGRSLRKAESRLLMVLVPDLANPYFAEIVRGVEALACARGYNILLADVSVGLDGQRVSMDAVHNRMADGVINLAHIPQRPEVVSMARDVPWVSCPEFLSDSKVPFVAIDQRQAMMDAVQYLINRKHKRIALIGGDEEHLWARQRREGYELALKRARIAVKPELVRAVPAMDYEQGQAAAGAFLALQQLPTAVLAVSDTLAIGAIKAFKKAGLKVPQDIAVVGFDNIPIADVFEPGITTIAQPMRQLGEVAAELLLERLAGGRPKPRILPHTLVVRDSA